MSYLNMQKKGRENRSCSLGVEGACESKFDVTAFKAELIYNTPVVQRLKVAVAARGALSAADRSTKHGVPQAPRRSFSPSRLSRQKRWVDQNCFDDSSEAHADSKNQNVDENVLKPKTAEKDFKAVRQTTIRWQHIHKSDKRSYGTAQHIHKGNRRPHDTAQHDQEGPVPMSSPRNETELFSKRKSFAKLPARADDSTCSGDVLADFLKQKDDSTSLPLRWDQTPGIIAGPVAGPVADWNTGARSLNKRKVGRVVDIPTVNWTTSPDSRNTWHKKVQSVQRDVLSLNLSGKRSGKKKLPSLFVNL